ncbi:MAG: hypothetical protein A3F91_15215 [Flavobacteria bacterium RIFCSPLOWO2_12_FULL_35_11]|nr:MAG: hypothetical protein A3F91_15215 [Flavobacteria bacterium RIFCSPLOWO2_12_FULL_35_11]
MAKSKVTTIDIDDEIFKAIRKLSNNQRTHLIYQQLMLRYDEDSFKALAGLKEEIKNPYYSNL